MWVRQKEGCGFQNVEEQLRKIAVTQCTVPRKEQEKLLFLLVWLTGVQTCSAQENLPWRWSWIPKSRPYMSTLGAAPSEFITALHSWRWELGSGRRARWGRWFQCQSSLGQPPLWPTMLPKAPELVPSWANQNIWGRTPLDSTSKFKTFPGVFKELSVSSLYCLGIACLRLPQFPFTPSHHQGHFSQIQQWSEHSKH